MTKSKKPKKSRMNPSTKEPVEDVDMEGTGQGDNDETQSETTPKSKQKKRGKKKKENHIHETVAQNKALNYLKLWRSEQKGKGEEAWKFSKCKQIWLLQNTYCDKKISDKDFKVLVKYMASIKGRSRQLALEAAQEKVDFAAKWQKMSDEGTLEADIVLELKKPKLEAKVLERAKRIAEKLAVVDQE